MPVYLDELLGRAFRVIPGEAYNRYRMEEEGRGARDLFFEVSLLEERPWAYLRDRIYPSFVRFLRYKRKDPESPEGVVVAVFRGDLCHLLRGRDFLRVFQEMEGLDDAGMKNTLRRWQ